MIRFNLINKNEKRLIGTLLLVIFAAFYGLNHWAFLMRDDYSYTLLWNDRGAEYGCPRVETLWDCIVSQYHHYNAWNGRVIIHTIVQFFAGVVGRGWFNVVNSAIFVLFVAAIARLSRTDGQLRPLNLLLAFIGSWFLLPDTAETTIWIAGSVNYLWSTTLFLYFILYFPRLSTSTIPAILLPVIGLLIGWTQEIPSFSLFGGLFLYYLLISKRPPHPREWWFIIGFTIGIAGLIVAPGNATRIEGSGFSIHRLLLEVVFIIKNGFLSWILVLAAGAYLLIKRKSAHTLILRNPLVTLTMLSSILLTLALMQGKGRMLFLADTLAIVLLLTPFIRIICHKKTIQTTTIILLSVAWMGSFAHNITMAKRQHAHNQEFTQTVIQNKGVITHIERHKSLSRLSLEYTLEEYFFAGFATYHGLKEIALRPSELMKQITPTDSYCTEANRVIPGKPLYKSATTNYYVLRLPRTSKSIIEGHLLYLLAERPDRRIRIKLGLMSPTMKNHFYYDFVSYQSEQYNYYIIEALDKRQAEKVVDLQYKTKII